MARTRPKRQGVQSESQQLHDGESRNQRNRNSYHRYDYCAPVLEEQQNDDHDNQRCLDKGDQYLVDRSSDKLRSVEHDIIFDSGRKILSELLEPVARRIGNTEGIGSGQLIDSHERTFMARHFRDSAVLLAAEIYPRNILNIFQIRFNNLTSFATRLFKKSQKSALLCRDSIANIKRHYRI